MCACGAKRVAGFFGAGDRSTRMGNRELIYHGGPCQVSESIRTTGFAGTRPSPSAIA